MGIPTGLSGRGWGLHPTRFAQGIWIVGSDFATVARGMSAEVVSLCGASTGSGTAELTETFSLPRRGDQRRDSTIWKAHQMRLLPKPSPEVVFQGAATPFFCFETNRTPSADATRPWNGPNHRLDVCINAIASVAVEEANG